MKYDCMYGSWDYSWYSHKYGNHPLYCRNDEAARALLPRIVCKRLAYMLEVLIETPLLHTFTARTQASHACG